MRVTNGMLTGGFLNGLNDNLLRLSKHQQQAITGRKLLNLSDDPIGIITSMSARNRLTRIEQYQKRVQSAQEFLTQTETSMMELNDVIQKAYETSVSAANGFLSPEDKEASAELIRELRDHVLDLGNSTFGDSYVFGGFNTKSAPFSIGDNGEILYNGKDLRAGGSDIDILKGHNTEFEIGLNMRMEVSFNGIDLIGSGENNIYSVFDDFYKALQADAPPEELGVFVDKLQDSQSHVLSLTAEVGGKSNRLELLKNRYRQDEENYLKVKSNVEDADEAEAVMNFKIAQTVYQYSLQVGANIMSMSLLDFLR